MTALGSEVQRSVVHVCRDASSENQRKLFHSLKLQSEVNLYMMAKQTVLSGWETG